MEHTNESAQRALLRALEELDQQLADLIEALQPAPGEPGMGKSHGTDRTSDGENKEDL